MAILSVPTLEKVARMGQDRRLVGVLTLPVTAAAGPHVVLLNSGILHRVGSNRLSVGLARALAQIGVTSLRFDLSGIGDSERRSDVGSLRESVARDIGEVLDYLSATQGATHFVLMGVCSGAYDALHAARGDHRIVGAVMVDLPGPFQGWRHTLHHARRMLRQGSWLDVLRKMVRYEGTARSARKPREANDPAYLLGGRNKPSREWMQEHLDALLARDVRLCFVFTAGLESNYNHRSQFATTFPRAARHRALTCRFFAEADHSFSSRAQRERLTDFTTRWFLTEWRDS